MSNATDQNAPTPERPGTVRGVWLVVATLSLFIIVPAITIGLWALLKDEGVNRQPLVWDDRGQWFSQSARPRPLKYNPIVQAETGKQYKKTNLVISPDVEQMLLGLATLAQRDDFFDAPQHRDTLLDASNQFDQQWYPPYLLASWHGANGDQPAYQRWMSVAFGRTSAAIIQRLVDPAGNPLAGHRLPPVAIGFDRVVEGEINPTLKLVYPSPVSDERGFVYLPAWPTIYRLADPASPLGVESMQHPTGLTLVPQPMDGSEPNWFSVPPPGIARLPDAVLDLQATLP
ncbi:MAG: hypothetical protein AAGC44_14970 [Planctomycetota bacterium]